MPLCVPSTREGRKGGSGTQVSPAVAAPGLEELGGSPQPLGVPLPGLAIGVGAARRTGAAALSYKVPL